MRYYLGANFEGVWVALSLSVTSLHLLVHVLDPVVLNESEPAWLMSGFNGGARIGADKSGVVLLT